MRGWRKTAENRLCFSHVISRKRINGKIRMGRFEISQEKIINLTVFFYSTKVPGLTWFSRRSLKVVIKETGCAIALSCETRDGSSSLFFFLARTYGNRRRSFRAEFNSTKQPRIPTPRNPSRRRFSPSTFLRSNIRRNEKAGINANELWIPTVIKLFLSCNVF